MGAEPAATGKGRILMVEDDRIDRMAFDRFVKREGFPWDYVWAGSVAETREKLTAGDFAAAVIDYRLGDGTAFDLLEKMVTLPVIVVTGAGDEEIAVRAMRRGAYDYLVKDRDGHYLKTLPAILENAIRHKQNEIELARHRRNLERLVAERTAELQNEILERKTAEEALAAEKELLRVTLESIGDGVISTDTDGRVMMINRAAEVLTGWSRQEATGQPLDRVFRLLDETSRTPCENPARIVLRSGQNAPLTPDVLLVSKDGAERVVADSGTPIRNREGAVVGVVLVFRDITHKRRMETELLRGEKLESLGILAGGIAHDFNNLLTGIIGNISLAKVRVDAGNDVQKELDGIEKAAIRAAGLTRQLLTFSRGGDPVKKTIRLADLIRESATFSLRGANVRCVFDLNDDLWPVEADIEQLGQVIQNLVINANQAMPDGGALTIRADNLRIDAASEATNLPPGRYVQVVFEDEGIGIPKDQLGKIFDPYFTTKQSGSGLGLATVYSIVDKHGGHIEAISEPGWGAIFTLCLPASDKRVSETPAVVRPPERGRERVLVMDDDEMVRRVARDMLQSIGYEAEVARDGEEVLVMYNKARKAGAPFDVVIMDLTVPGGMGGKQAIGALKALDPEARVIVSSGYSTDPVMSDYQAYGFVDVITKPYKIEALSEVLHGVVHGDGLEKP